jgi:outer membrane cobalamin receptor
MSAPRIVSALAFVVLLVAGCASGSGERAARPQPNVITAEEIQPAQFRSAFELIRALRPQWLTTTGSSIQNQGAGQILVYVDGMRMGGTAFLSQIPTTDMRGARWLSATEATIRYGTGHSGGAIEILTRR